MVSHYGSDVNSGQGTPDRNVYIRNGILILDGAESSTRNDTSASVFSIPGTDSLPSDVGTLQGQEFTFPNAESRRKTWTIPKYSGLLFLSVLCSFLLYNTYNWRSSSLQFQQQILEHEATIQRLEKEAEESKMIVDDSDESDYITLLDNCWVKAQARWCDKSAPSTPSTGGFSLPSMFGEAIGEASKIMSKKVSSLKDAMQEIPNSASTEFKAATEAVTQASDVLSLFVGAAGVAMAAEYLEFSGNPLDYVAEAVKGASQNSESKQEVNAKDLKEDMNTASSPSNDWSKAFKRTAVKMTELMDDPLSYFEYETKVSEQRKEL